MNAPEQSWLAKLRAVAAEAKGSATTIYLLETVERAAAAGVAPRPESLSRLGAYESDLVLTIDLSEVPPLAKAYPGMSTLSFFAEDKRIGCYKTAKLLAGPARDGERPLVIIPIDLPFAGEVRGLLRGVSGWALGEPIGVQDAPRGDELIMQLHERLGLNCGDSGAVYVFHDHAEMQSC